jgi:hypothetical protein
MPICRNFVAMHFFVFPTSITFFANPLKMVGNYPVVVKIHLHYLAELEYNTIYFIN